MTQRRKAFFTPRSVTNRCSLFLGVSLIGGIGVLGGNLALAQSVPTLNAEASASAEDLVVPAPSVEAIRPAAIAPRQTAPQQTAPRRSQAASSAPRVERATPSAIAPSTSAEPERFAPESSARPSSRTLEQPSTPQAVDGESGAIDRVPSPTVTLSQPAAGTAGSTRPNYSELYIDPTNYQVGATRQPGVVLSERSTGCEVVLQAGQNLPNSVCIDRDRQVDGNTVAATNGGGEAGGVTIGPIRLSSRGVSINPQSVQDFYNRTIRPMAMPGNGNARLMFPLSIPASITSAFGWRIHPISGTGRFHSGTDLGAPTGTPVVAAYSGAVDTARFMGGYGLAVILQHNNGAEQSLYAHLSEIFVQPGQQVQQGEVIGRVGSTGNSTGPHLHFEFRELTPQGWVALNPVMVLEDALARFTNPFQVAAAPTLDNALPTIAVKGLEDFGKLASDAKPTVTVTSAAASNAKK